MITSVILLILGFGLPFGYFYLKKNPKFGGKLEKDEKETLSKSGHWKKGKFQNLSKTHPRPTPKPFETYTNLDVRYILFESETEMNRSFHNEGKHIFLFIVRENDLLFVIVKNGQFFYLSSEETEDGKVCQTRPPKAICCRIVCDRNSVSETAGG